MGDITGISWTDHTFNPWEGCQKVGPGCDHCYAETRNARFNHKVAINWGPGAPRRKTSEHNWNNPYRWNRKAEKEGRKHRVFCASLADVFDNAVDPIWRADTLDIPRQTPWLDWQFLTKRIGNVMDMVPPYWFWDSPQNAGIGATMVNQTEWDRDMGKLRETQRSLGLSYCFASVEPMLGPIDAKGQLPDWVIVGGESGTGARSMDPEWARNLRDQCAEAGVPFFMKQMSGERMEDREAIPADLFIQEFPLAA